MNVLVVGSSVIDLFVKLQDQSQAKIVENSVSLSLGDKVPIDIRRVALGGDGANISVGLKRLSIDTTFYTYFGQDLFSKEMEERLKKEGINLIAQNAGEKSSLSVIFSFNNDRIIFSHHEVREHNFFYKDKKPDFIYLTSIGDDWTTAYRQVLEFVRENKIPFGFTPGTKQLKEKSEIVEILLREARIVFINKEEAKKILKFQNIEFMDEIWDIALKFKKLGMEVLSITDGTNGAYTVDRENNLYFISSYKGEVVERTGAGDAYTSGFLSYYFLRYDIPECMRRGAFNAHSTVLGIGAQEGLLNKEQMEKIAEENRGFTAKKI